MGQAKDFSWNNHEAREALDRYEGVVRAMARRLRPAAMVGQALDVEDLCAEGRIAVLEAIRSYAGFGIEERTWVRTRVRQRMIDAIRRLDLCTRDEMRLAVRQATGEAMDQDDYERGRAVLARRLVSMDATVVDNEPLAARIRDSVIPSAEQNAHAHAQQARLLDALTQIAPRQREAIELGVFEGLALREIGERMGISESRVCQLQKRAVEHLRRAVDPMAEQDAA